MTVILNANTGTTYTGFDDFRTRVPHQTQPSPKPTVNTEPQADEVQITPQAQPQEQAETPAVEKKPKKSIWAKMRGAYASFKKGVVASVEYTKGTIKGAAYGVVAAASVLGIDAIANKVQKSEKTFSKKGKVFAGLAAAGALAINLFQSYLNVNEKKAQIDHRWQTGHDAV